MNSDNNIKNSKYKKDMQSKFKISIPGGDLNPENDVFYVKLMIDEFINRNKWCFDEIEKKKGGRPKIYKNRELFSLFIWGIYDGKTSLNELHKELENNNETYLFITNNKKPKSSTLNDFYQEKSYLIDMFFDFTAQYSIEIGLASTDKLAIDGTIYKAPASKNKLLKIEQIRYMETLLLILKNKEQKILFQQLRSHFLNNEKIPQIKTLTDQIKFYLNSHGLKMFVKALKNEKEYKNILNHLKKMKINYDGKHPVSITDPESRFMLDKKKNKGLNYNNQVVSDANSGIILYQQLVNAPTDTYQLLPLLKEIEATFGKHSHQRLILADGIYLEEKALQYAFYNRVKLIIPDRQESEKAKKTHKDKKYAKNKFKYDFINDTFICPENEILTYKSSRKSGTGYYRVYSTNKCLNCKSKHLCTKSRIREIIEKASPLKLEAKKDFHAFKEIKIYNSRAPVAEGIFGIIKEAHNFRGIKRIGIKKANTELKTAAIRININKIINFIKK